MTGTADGYTSNVFQEKDIQLKAVADIVQEKGFIPKELVVPEVNWFYQ